VNGDFLVINYTISYLEALSWPANSQPQRTNRFLGFAPFSDSKPIIPENEAGAAFRNHTDLSELTGSLKEIENAGTYFNSEIFSSTSATETQLKSNNGTLKAVHLATHGLMEDDNPLMNSIILAGDSMNDGLLHTYELFHLKLPAELAILSACNTGNGNYQQGEGMLSLATGFYTAGVQNILFTLWSIPDKQSTDLVSDFYRYWQDENQTMGEALRDAKLNYLANADQLSKHPFFWAGFVLHSKELTNKVVEASLVWWYAGGLFLLAIILFLIIYKRNHSKASSISRAF
jgi:CHAT domain-containing protein